MSRSFHYCIAVALLLACARGTAFDDTEITRFSHPDWFKQSFFHLGDDLADADANGKRGVALFFSTQGCAYCRLMLRRTFADPALAARLRRAFDVIGLEMFDDAEITDWDGKTLRIKELAVREGAQFSPTVVFYDTRGRRLLRLVGYYDPRRFGLALQYLTEAGPADSSFGTWLKRRREADGTTAGEIPRRSSAPPAGTPDLRLDRRRVAAERPLLVLFERADCAECRRFDREVLGDAAIRRELGAFEVVRLDAADRSSPLLTPSGATTTPAAWWDDLGFTRLPALVWFDEHGRQVLATDALVREGRLANALGYVRERAYAKGWTYQRYARTENLRRLSRESGSTTPP